MVLGLSAAVCIGTGGMGCLAAGGVVASHLAAKSLETDLEIILEKSDMDEDTKSNIMNTSKLGINTVFAFASLSNAGGVVDVADDLNLAAPLASFAELSWVFRPKLNKLEFDDNGNISDYSFEIRLDDGAVLIFTSSTISDTNNDSNDSRTFKYYDTEITLQNGNKFLGNVISGEFEGINFGISTPQRTNYFVFLQSSGFVIDILNNEIKSVIRKRIKIVSVGFPFVRLNMGEESGIQVGQLYFTYKEKKDLIFHTYDKFFTGQIQIIDIGPNTAKAIIIKNNKKGYSIERGNFCL
jgi:hypothetical protein